MPGNLPYLPCPTSRSFTFILLFLSIEKNCYVAAFLYLDGCGLIFLAGFYAALIDEELRLEEAQLRAKEQELLAALNQPSSTEVSIPVVETSSSQVVPEVTGDLPAKIPAVYLPATSSSVVVASPATTSLPIIELTFPISLEKSLAEVAPSKRLGRKLTRAPPPKRRLILSGEELLSEDFASTDLPSDELTLANLYSSLVFSDSPSSGTSAPSGTYFTFPLSFTESGSLPSSFSSYLVFAPPSIPTSSFSMGSSTVPVLPILLGGSFASAWEEIHPLFGELTTPETIDQFSHKETQQVADMSSARTSEESKQQYEAQIESLQSQFKSATDLNKELTSKLEKQTVEINELKSNYESALANKLKALQPKDDEITSLNTSLNSAKTKASTKEAELQPSQTALVVYKAGEDGHFKDRAIVLI
ncbi:cell wall protein TIR4-like [Zingiber officinale]|uniref:cell wall protein TIR4-like n=1 Tax=Zingiber officinale TaxID=94328 RepID=UPI001C4C7692|nr:cell wall protein TIR4-like [Zingiber officinale]